MSKKYPRSIFLWKALHKGPIEFVSDCPWCGTPTQWRRFDSDGDPNNNDSRRYQSCPLCGWYYEKFVFLMKTEGLFHGIYKSPILKSLNINMGRSILNKITSHFSKMQPDALSAWGDIEKEVAHICKQNGCFTVFAKQCDLENKRIFIITKNKNHTLILAKNRDKPAEIEFDFVRYFVGVHVKWESGRAHLVILNEHTPISKVLGEHIDKNSFVMDLASTAEVLKHLNLYNPDMPPITELDQRVRMRIIEDNRQYFQAS